MRSFGYSCLLPMHILAIERFIETLTKSLEIYEKYCELRSDSVRRSGIYVKAKTGYDRRGYLLNMVCIYECCRAFRLYCGIFCRKQNVLELSTCFEYLDKNVAISYNNYIYLWSDING